MPAITYNQFIAIPPDGPNMR